MWGRQFLEAEEYPGNAESTKEQRRIQAMLKAKQSVFRRSRGVSRQEWKWGSQFLEENVFGVCFLTMFLEENCFSSSKNWLPRSQHCLGTPLPSPKADSVPLTPLLGYASRQHPDIRARWMCDHQQDIRECESAARFADVNKTRCSSPSQFPNSCNSSLS